MSDPVQIANKWRLAMADEGGIGEILDRLEVSYIKRLSELEPWETDKMHKLASAAKVTRAVKAEIMSIIASGKVEEDRRAHVERIEKLPVTKRRFL